MNALTAGLLAATLSCIAAGDAGANGREVQREVLARVVSVDAGAGTLVVERELRGRVWRLALRVPPATVIFDCRRPAGTLRELRAGDQVSVYYEPVGREGLANLVVLESPR